MFLAKSRRLGLKKILLGTVVIALGTEYAAALIVDEANRTTDHTKTIENYELNTRAFEDLILAIDGSLNAVRVAWSLVEGSKTMDLPDGDAALAFKNIRENYAPQLAPSYVSLNKLFINSELIVDKDPEIFLTELETVAIRMNKCNIQGKSDKTDIDIIFQVIKKLPKAYEIKAHQVEFSLNRIHQHRLKTTRSPTYHTFHTTKPR